MKIICDQCINNHVIYGFDCNYCGCSVEVCRHHVFKCKCCKQYFCSSCASKCKVQNENYIICNYCYKQLLL